MQKIILSKEQVAELVRESRYKIDGEVVNLAELSFVGNAAEETALIEEASKQYGFIIEEKKLEDSLTEVLPSIDSEGNSIYEGAVILLEGGYSINPNYLIEIAGKERELHTFLHHKTVIDRRHKFLSSKLVQDKAVELLGGTDEEYLYEVLTLTQEDLLFEHIKLQAPGLPIYSVRFDLAGSFKIDDQGKIE